MFTRSYLNENRPQRILIVRTDRVGDVLLSTPVIKACRHAFPEARIAFMVRPYTSQIVMKNPYLDEVVIYDKYGLHKGWWGSIKFALALRKRRFDLALILHPTNRAHIITFLARIPQRVGYRKKCGWLLTEAIEDTKHLGQKHELEYNFELAKLVGIKPVAKELIFSVGEKEAKDIDNLLLENGIALDETLVALHPGASCPSKRWSPQNFALVGDNLSREFKVILLGGPDEKSIAKGVESSMRGHPLNLCGALDLAHLGALIKRCKLFITNDNGPMHIASAVGTPVVAIFGRKQPGLGPTRWGPTGPKDVILHKDVGCTECLAHNCKKGFECLKAVSVEEVVEAAKKIPGLTPNRLR